MPIPYHWLMSCSEGWQQEKAYNNFQEDHVRLCIQYYDEHIRRSISENYKKLIQTASNSSEDDVNALLARKALRYRGVLSRVEAIEKHLADDPTFDIVDRCMRVKWRKVYIRDKK